MGSLECESVRGCRRLARSSMSSAMLTGVEEEDGEDEEVGKGGHVFFIDECYSMSGMNPPID